MWRVKKLLFADLVVLLHVCKPQIISVLAACMFQIWSLKVRPMFFVKMWYFSVFFHQNLRSQFFTMQWPRKLLFCGLVVLIHTCKHSNMSIVADCMCEISSLKVRSIFWWKCDISVYFSSGTIKNICHISPKQFAGKIKCLCNKLTS